MRFIISIFISLLVFTSCSKTREVELTLLVKVDSIKSIAIATPYDYFEVDLDEFDMAVKDISVKEACFATVLCAGAGLEVFLTPGKNINLEISSIDGQIDFDVECDDGGICDYLVSDLKNSRLIKYADFYDKEARFIEKLDSLLDIELMLADTLDFPESFKALNAERIKFNVLSPIGIYPQYHSYVTNDEDYLPSQAFFDFVDKYTVETPSMFGLLSYIGFMDNIAVCSANRHIKDWDSHEFTTNSLSYITDSIKNADLKEILISKRVESFLRSKGLWRADTILDIANEYVKKPIYKNYIDTLIVGWKKIAKGEKSYPFSFKDTSSNRITLDSFKGKYTLISVGATWCLPCKDEIKAFEELVNKHNDIAFVNVSIDKDFKNWTRYVNKTNYKALQLNLSGDQPFLEKYMVYTIPRFILLDKDGNILESRMPTASDDHFKKILEEL